MRDNLSYRATPNDDVSSFELFQDDILIGCVYNDLPISEAKGNAEFICKSVNNHKILVDALMEAKLQIEYLQGKFKETGTGNAVLAQIETALNLTNKNCN